LSGDSAVRAVQVTRAGGDPSGIVAGVDLRMLLVALPLIALQIFIARRVVAHRVAPLDDLAGALATAGATPEQAERIIGRLVALGLRDVGSVGEAP
jgi:hypothetical protein